MDGRNNLRHVREAKMLSKTELPRKSEPSCAVCPWDAGYLRTHKRVHDQEIEIKWPLLSGKIERFTDLPKNRYVRLSKAKESGCRLLTRFAGYPPRRRHLSRNFEMFLNIADKRS